MFYQVVKQVKPRKAKNKMKSVFKLAAISAAALTLVACGGGGGGGSVSAPALVKQEPPANVQTLAPSRVLPLSVGANQAALPAPAPAPIILSADQLEEAARVTAAALVTAANLAAAQAAADLAAAQAATLAAAVLAEEARLAAIEANRWNINPTKTISANYQNDTADIYFGSGNDLVVQHKLGFTGQGVGILIASSSVAGAGQQQTLTQVAAPNANTQILWTQNTGYLSVVAPAAQVVAFKDGAGDSVLSGVIVSSAASNQFTIAAGSVGKPTGFVSAPVITSSVSFENVNTGSSAVLGQPEKVAYLAGAAAVIQSKFINLTNTDVVTYMGTGVVNGVFRLGNTLAPSTLR